MAVLRSYTASAILYILTHDNAGLPIECVGEPYTDGPSLIYRRNAQAGDPLETVVLPLADAPNPSWSEAVTP